MVHCIQVIQANGTLALLNLDINHKVVDVKVRGTVGNDTVHLMI